MQPVDNWNAEMFSWEAPTLAPKVGFALETNQIEVMEPSTTPRVPPPPLIGEDALICSFNSGERTSALLFEAAEHRCGTICSWLLPCVTPSLYL